jgi:hypothetical protein
MFCNNCISSSIANQLPKDEENAEVLKSTPEKAAMFQ